ncbi:P-loop NTPase [Candidatus Woesearchaeota archaeon]|nr:P-loop NTPase [Candidatus Woesearchaeota archaeon]
MTRYITCISGKGGVSKTTTSINLGAAFTYFGKDTTVVDANLTTPNVGVHLGVPIVPINLNHVLQGKNHISEAVYLHPVGTKIVPASISINDLKNTNPGNLRRALRGLHGTTDIVLIDSAAGLGREALLAMESGDEILIVTNPELPAITDALKTVKVAEELGKKIIGVVLTRTKKDNGDLSANNIETMLEKPIIAVIPEDKSVREALTMKDVVVYTHPKSDAAVAYKKLAASLLNREYNEENQEEGTIKRLLKKLKIVK